MRASSVLFALIACVAAAPHAQDDEPVGASSTAAAPPAPSTSLAIPDPTTSLSVSTSLNVPVTSELSSLPTSFASSFGSIDSTTKRHGHSEPVPIFSKSCDCPNLATMLYPCYATDALQRCYFEENHSYVCWTSADRGCPYPTRSCAALFNPTPITGRHPCDPSSPEDPTETPAPVITSVPLLNSTSVPLVNSTSVPLVNSTSLVVPTITSVTTIITQGQV